jgi:hypothetical protein
MQRTRYGVHVRQNVVERSVTASDYNHREAQNILTSVPADMTRGDGEGVTYGDVYHYLPRHLERGDKITPQQKPVTSGHALSMNVSCPGRRLSAAVVMMPCFLRPRC